MDIYALHGHKVKCSTLTAGYKQHQEIAKKYLVIGDEYTVDYTVVSDWHTDVYLKEFSNIKFNSVFFDDINEIATEIVSKKKAKKVTTKSRKTAYTYLKDFCSFADESDFIEITEWTNGEGFDLQIQTERNTEINQRFTWGEWDALKKLVGSIKTMS